MRKIGIMAGVALYALAATGAQAQAPLAGAYYGSVPGPAPAPASAWQGAPMVHAPHHGDRQAYRAYQRGMRMGDIWRDPTYAVNDWQAWGLGQPGPGMHWMRYYDDAILVDAYGTVVDCRHGVTWDAPRPGPMAAPLQGYAGGPAYPGPGTTVTRVGPNTTVTTQVIGGGGCCGAGYAGAYAVGPGMITITPGSVVTTTTTTTEETVYKNVYRKRSYRRPVRHYRPRCVQAPTCPVQGS